MVFFLERENDGGRKEEADHGIGQVRERIIKRGRSL